MDLVWENVRSAATPSIPGSGELLQEVTWQPPVLRFVEQLHTSLLRDEWFGFRVEQVGRDHRDGLGRVAAGRRVGLVVAWFPGSGSASSDPPCTHGGCTDGSA